VLALKPWEFWRLTPRELQLLLDGAELRDDRDWRQMAQLAVWLLAPWSKKKLKVDKLLGGRPKQRRRRDNPPSFWNDPERST
jgi:Phage tail assembly chaperone protein, TAC